MQALDYRPNLLAIADRTSNSIGLVVSTFDGATILAVCCAGRAPGRSHNKQLIVAMVTIRTPERRRKPPYKCWPTNSAAIILYTRYMDEPAIL